MNMAEWCLYVEKGGMCETETFGVVYLVPDTGLSSVSFLFSSLLGTLGVVNPL